MPYQVSDTSALPPPSSVKLFTSIKNGIIWLLEGGVKIMSTITAKIQIYVSDNQAQSLRITTSAYRKACNWLSKQIFETKNLI